MIISRKKLTDILNVLKDNNIPIEWLEDNVEV